jgi:hypothetical protein
MNMKKHLFIAATALLALASCTDDSFVGEQSVKEANENVSINFDYQFQNTTRAESDHATSAANLGNQFIVWGEKSTGGSDTKDAPADGHIVFPNYQVNYGASTANTTTSNSKDWEYVGYTHSTNYQDNITYKASTSEAVKGSSVAQTIKYWDYSAGSYTFTAVSASKLTNSKTDIENGYVKIQKNIDDDDKVSEKGYIVTVTANADLSKLYFSDRTVITKGTGTDRTATNAYGGNVTLKFRNALSQIRAGIYETIPGYAISDIKFYVNTSGDSPTQTQVAQVGETPVDAFGAICPNIKGMGYAGDLTVTYSEETATLNQPVVSASGTVNTNLILGTNISTVTTDAPLGTSATDPTWDTSAGAYTNVLLQGAHTTNLKLKCDYTLYNSVSGETIEVKDATVEVPYQYLQWKPNYKYTYLFKITDEKLYPITFDAIEITNSDGLAEYITIVNQPSVTTFGAIYNTTDNKYTAYQTGKDEYQLQTSSNQLDIYATFLLGANVLTPQLTSSNKANFVTVYAVTTTDATNFPITEASVAESIIHPTGNKITATAIQTENNDYFGNDPSYVDNVPAEDGTTRSIHALKLPGVKAAGKYAVEIVTYEEVTGLTAGTSDVDGYYTLDTDETYDGASGKAAESTKYYKQVKTYKVITVQSAS